MIADVAIDLAHVAGADVGAIRVWVEMYAGLKDMRALATKFTAGPEESSDILEIRSGRGLWTYERRERIQMSDMHGKWVPADSAPDRRTARVSDDIDSDLHRIMERAAAKRDRKSAIFASDGDVRSTSPATILL